MDISGLVKCHDTVLGCAHEVSELLDVGPDANACPTCIDFSKHGYFLEADYFTAVMELSLVNFGKCIHCCVFLMHFFNVETDTNYISTLYLCMSSEQWLFRFCTFPQLRRVALLTNAVDTRIITSQMSSAIRSKDAF